MKNLFVSFVFNDGSGNITIEGAKKIIIHSTSGNPINLKLDKDDIIFIQELTIADEEDIRTLQQFLELKTQFENIVITNFRRLERKKVNNLSIIE